MIDPITIEKIRDTAQILDVVSEFVSLRRRGQNYVGLCPFHSDKNPSFYVSPAKNVCKCFSCGEGGDPIHFIMKHEQIGYLEALRWLAKRYGIEIQEKEMTAEERAAQNAREGMIHLNEFAMQTFEHDLYESEEGKTVGLTYFRERGLQDETIKRYHLGYALENKTDLATRAIKAGHNRSYLLDPTETVKEGVGLCYADNDHQTPICRFHGRVIFPCMSLSGKPVAFGGRILQRVDHAFKKYVNSPESIIYHKGNMLYGIYQAKQFIAQRDKCYIVEGNVDVLSMAQAGFGNVVASAGTALTTNQIHIIKRFTNNVTLMFDGDEAGIRASLKSIDLLLLEGMKVKLLLFPDGDDPDSFCRKHTSEEIQSFFDRSEQDFISYKTNLLLRGAGTDPQKRSAVLQNIVQSIALIDDPIMSSLYLRQTAQSLNVSEQALMQALQNQRRSNYAAELRRWEIEQRRAEAQAQLQAQAQMEQLERGTEGTAAAVSASAASASEGAAPTTTTDSPRDDAQDYADAMADMYGEPSAPASNPPAAPVSPVATPATPDTVPGYTPQPTDRFERNIIRYVMRYGGECFDYSFTDENGNEKVERWRVIDFIGSVLSNEQIEFHHPLYSRILLLAYDATADPNVEFNSIRFFSCHEDPAISQLALDLITDRNEAIVSVRVDLSTEVPRALLELQECIIRQQIADLNLQLRNRIGDPLALMQQLNDLTQIKKDIDKCLGERIITG